MQTQNPFLSKTLNPSLAIFQFPIPLRKTLIPIRVSPQNPQPIHIQCLSQNPNPSFARQNLPRRRDVRSSAGRSKKSPDGPSPGRIEGNAQVRREAKRNARKRSRRLAENLFYRLKNPHKNYPDNFSEEELQMIGLGYDRMVRFMEKDDPNLRHPYDWFKYGEFGPYSWRGVVLGEPIRGRLTDECVTMIGEVRDHEEWERIEQFEMAQDFGKRLNSLDKSVGLKYFWVFVRHPKWRVSDLPWQQWTLVCEVVLEAGNQRLDKWNLMGRLGNKARALITQCAAWMRPDVIYVKRPVYQCRFEPQDEFFRALTPLLDPETEQDFLFELELEGYGNGGRVELCTYFGGLCKIVKVNPKAFVDDVVKGFEKLNDEGKSKCLEFLLVNHPVPLLHPYTKEWKAKLEEMELGCDAPDDDDDDYRGANGRETGVVDWMEDDGEDDIVVDMDMEADGDGKLGMKDDIVVDMDMEADGDGTLGMKDAEEEEGNENYWNEEFGKALSSNEAMEGIAKRSVEMSTKMYKKQLRTMEENGESPASEDGDELAIRGNRAKVSPKEWKVVGYGPFRKRIKKSRIPPELFLRAAVRPFTYRNLVKEIVLTRHAILEGEIGGKK
ncbi:uncharacterized protein LOC127792076 [Diospyros lotus]|uniref:uncharacterized protein LOC127792076 n=1 Tax=Diospyros lotus TaxID=55363 RepID=UPI002258FC03|nr:uncharacterized protein LOC127792076 [Diospyros lotus]